jgi:hypothetical protein
MGLSTLRDLAGCFMYGWLIKHAHPLCPDVGCWVIKHAVYSHRIKYGKTL